MAKIMLVEDDKNLSAIYKDRLLAEGYDIIEAHDGEEALALAVKEKPELIISDVMMPKISGFDMLDILRSTPETKNTRVIMMTALSQAEDQQRATQLGADKYLVKSQVTLDDVARVVKEILDGGDKVASSGAIATAQPSAVPIASAPAPTPESQTEVQSSSNAETPIPATAQTPASIDMPAESVAEEKKEIEDEIQKLAENLPSEAPSEVNSGPQPAEVKAEEPKHGGERVLQPLSDPNDKPDIMALYEKEIANEPSQTNAPIEQQPPQPTDPHSISL